MYEGEVTELTPCETENPMGGYGKTISHVIIGLKTAKGTKQLKVRMREKLWKLTKYYSSKVTVTLSALSPSAVDFNVVFITRCTLEKDGVFLLLVLDFLNIVIR